jgi:hypothetical protein
MDFDPRDSDTRDQARDTTSHNFDHDDDLNSKASTSEWCGPLP